MALGESMQQGDLRERPLPDLFMDLSALGQSGALTLTRAGITKTIYFEAGKLIFAASTDPNDRLGEVLVRQRVIGVRDLLETQKKLKPGIRLGALLVERKLLAPEQLVEAVLAQVRGIILGAFEWTDGEFEFNPKLEISKEVIRLDLPARDIVREGIGRIDNVERILAALGRLEPAWKLTPECEERLAGWSLGEPEHRLLALLGEARKFAALADANLMPEIDLARFLWALAILGIVRPVSEDESSLDAMMDDAFGTPPPVAKQVAPAPQSTQALRKTARTAALPAAPEPPPPPRRESAPEKPPPPPKPRPPTDDVADFTADDFEFGGAEPALPDPSAPETVAKVEAPADEISRAIAEFGMRHKAVLKILHARDAAKTGSFVGFCLREVRKSHPRLYQGLEPETDGGLAIDKLLANIRGQKLQNYTGGLRDLHEVLTRRAKTWQGVEIAKQCREAAGLPEG